ncbi:preprotein translocase subunit SecE, partial [Candidatus Nomurabacteria bacterium]|nr:preprotein translocase subunit SecE [Candidatus Nomurabacteria bacterium]
MENQSQKWVNLCYAAAAFLLGFIVSSFCMKLAGVYDLETKIRNIEIIIRIVSIISGVVLFVVLYRNVEVNQFMNEVVTELSRVTWPTQKETSSATVVVIIMVIISGLLLGLLDYTWTAVV